MFHPIGKNHPAVAIKCFDSCINIQMQLRDTWVFAMYNLRMQKSQDGFGNVEREGEEDIDKD